MRTFDTLLTAVENEQSVVLPEIEEIERPLGKPPGKSPEGLAG